MTQQDLGQAMVAAISNSVSAGPMWRERVAFSRTCSFGMSLIQERLFERPGGAPSLCSDRLRCLRVQQAHQRHPASEALQCAGGLYYIGRARSRDFSCLFSRDVLYWFCWAAKCCLCRVKGGGASDLPQRREPHCAATHPFPHCDTPHPMSHRRAAGATDSRLLPFLRGSRSSARVWNTLRAQLRRSTTAHDVRQED